MMERIEKISERFRKIIEEREWKQFHNPLHDAVDIAVEAGELLELFQWKHEKDLPEFMRQKQNEIEAELADVFLSCLKFAEDNNIDILTAAERKLDEIEKKYPLEKSRGSNKKYTEL